MVCFHGKKIYFQDLVLNRWYPDKNDWGSEQRFPRQGNSIHHYIRFEAGHSTDTVVVNFKMKII